MQRSCMLQTSLCMCEEFMVLVLQQGWQEFQSKKGQPVLSLETKVGIIILFFSIRTKPAQITCTSNTLMVPNWSIVLHVYRAGHFLEWWSTGVLQIQVCGFVLVCFSSSSFCSFSVEDMKNKISQRGSITFQDLYKCCYQDNLEERMKNMCLSFSMACESNKKVKWYIFSSVWFSPVNFDHSNERFKIVTLERGFLHFILYAQTIGTLPKIKLNISILCISLRATPWYL